MHWLVVTAALATVVASPSNVLLTNQCPNNSPSFCLVDTITGATVIANWTNSNGMNSTHMLDLSNFGIQSIHMPGMQWPPQLKQLNLSHNNLTTLDSINQLPRSLDLLDLSENEIASLDNIDWRVFPNLITLVLRGNNISTMRKPIFPTSLQTLDLVDNPLAVVHVDGVTATQLTAMTLSMHKMNQRGNDYVCVAGDLVYVGTNAVCVGDVKHSRYQGWTRICSIVVGLAVVLLFIAAAIFFLNRTLSAKTRRPTVVESDDEEEAQARVTMTEIHTIMRTPP
ncbi:Aste57867_17483 [Aphanomyces stellatus]|uniref:Aste57867_17483 protein n=1 Tax=Aphanomyces stellatus TaxID=120398 RepID=A0A485L7X0_9STRA|nr:hypothetical protein As57867_017423 [Aphanomyces stellatus]VFT94236.1 Aste57867_17483 [Aphanomyces stellatus]